MAVGQAFGNGGGAAAPGFAYIVKKTLDDIDAIAPLLQFPEPRIPLEGHSDPKRRDILVGDGQDIIVQRVGHRFLGQREMGEGAGEHRKTPGPVKLSQFFAQVAALGQFAGNAVDTDLAVENDMNQRRQGTIRHPHWSGPAVPERARRSRGEGDHADDDGEYRDQETEDFVADLAMETGKQADIDNHPGPKGEPDAAPDICDGAKKLGEALEEFHVKEHEQKDTNENRAQHPGSEIHHPTQCEGGEQHPQIDDADLRVDKTASAGGEEFRKRRGQDQEGCAGHQQE